MNRTLPPYYLLASQTSDEVDLTLAEYDGQFIVEAIDLDADYRENCIAFRVLDSRLQAWHTYDTIKAELF